MSLLPAAELRFRQFLIAVHGNEHIYSIPANVFVDEMFHGRICRWSKARKEDAIRVSDIRAAVAKTRSISGVIYLAYLPTSEATIKLNSQYTLCCYDGNHRRLAIDETLSSSILTSIIWTASVQNIADIFVRINQTVAYPVISLQLSAIDNNDSIVISEYISYLVSTYPKMRSKSEQWHSPHFNDSRLLEQIVRLHNDFTYITVPNLTKLLVSVNECYKKEIFFSKQSICEKYRKKCEKSGLWLFCATKDFDREYIRRIIVITSTLRQ